MELVKLSGILQNFKLLLLVPRTKYSLLFGEKQIDLIGWVS